jgi:hypothetical protein
LSSELLFDLPAGGEAAGVVTPFITAAAQTTVNQLQVEFAGDRHISDC